MEVMCRVCLSTGKEMFPLDECFISQYNLLTSLNINLCDGMPQYSCETCLNAVKCFIEFREKSIAAEATLRDIISATVKQEDFKKEIEFKIKPEVKNEQHDESDCILDFQEIYEDYYENDIPNVKKERRDNSIMKKEVKHRIKTNKRKAELKLKKSKKCQKMSKDDKWLCGLCPASFGNKEEMKIHVNTHKNMRECELCDERVFCESQIFAHRLKHLPQPQLKCHMCFKRYRACLYLEHHFRTVHIENDDTKLKCSYCEKTFPTPRRLFSHITMLHSSYILFCDICRKGFTNKSSLTAHIKIHSATKSYVCDLCGFSCKFSTGLKEHKIRRHAQKKINCKNCSRPFLTQEGYDAHKCSEKFTICPVCGIKVNRTNRMSIHMQTHTDYMRYECQRCPAKYKSKAALVAHNKRHDNNRTEQCEYCPAKFYTLSVLIKHRRIHTGEKPYVCKKCGKGFTGNHNLKVHMKVHGEYLVVKKNSKVDPDINNSPLVIK